MRATGLGLGIVALVCLLGLPTLAGDDTRAGFGVVLAAKVNVRHGPSSKEKVAARIDRDLTVVEVLAEGEKKVAIELYGEKHQQPWFQIASKAEGAKIEGWLYGAFLKRFKTEAEAKAYAKSVVAERNAMAGNWTLRGQPACTFDTPEYAIDPDQGGCSLELKADGSHNYQADAVIGDHIEQENGDGRFYPEPESKTIRLFLVKKAIWAPDAGGYSPAQYYEMQHGKKPTKKQLKKYLKEMNTPKITAVAVRIPFGNVIRKKGEDTEVGQKVASDPKAAYLVKMPLDP